MSLFDPKTRTMRIDKVDEDTYEGFNAMCDERGIARDRMFAVMVKAFNKRPTVFDLSDELTFGKYRGLLLEDVIRADSRYIAWLLRESSWFQLAPHAELLLTEMESD
jgi:hypothetical protein